MNRRIISAIVAAVLVLSGSVFAQSLEWPAVTHTTKPWTRWWWLGSILSEREVTAEMEKYAKANIGGLEITPIYGVKGQESRFLNYLSPNWMRQFEHSLKEAKRLDMGVDMATGNGWPFGGIWVDPADACRYVGFKTYTVAAGGQLTELVTYTDPVLVRTIGRQVTIEQLKDPIGANTELQQIAPEQVRFPRKAPLLTLMAYSDTGERMDLTPHVAADGKLNWTAPAGNWTLHAAFMGWHGKLVERAGPGGEGDVIDHFNSGSLTRYLKKFDDAFAGRDLSGLRGFFNDSYEVDDATGESNWTANFFGEFQKRRGYDLRQQLPALLATQPNENSQRVITDFRETISDLLLDEFTIPWQKWAAAKGKIIRNQAHGSPANILDLYAASDIPEQEGQQILRFKMASSAAHVMGKQLTAAEAATWMNDHWLSTLETLKLWCDRYFLGGINHICYHGTAYSPANEPWPGILFYASVELQPTNPFWTDFAALNQYVMRVQSFMQAGKPDNDILVYYPIHDIWSEPAAAGGRGGGRGRGARGAEGGAASAPAASAPRVPALLQHFAAPGGASATTGQAHMELGHTYDYISDRQITGTSFSDGAIRTSGGTAYRMILVPPTRSIPIATLKKLVELAEAGAVVAFQGELPSDVPGMGSLDARKAELQQLVTRINLGPAAATGNRASGIASGRIVAGPELAPLLNQRWREPMVEKGLQFERRSMDGGKSYFIYNPGQQAFSGWVRLATPARKIGLFNPWTGDRGAGQSRTRDNANEVFLQLDPAESVIVRTFDSDVTSPGIQPWQPGEPVALTSTWTVRFTDGGPQLPSTAQVSELKSWTEFAGDPGKVFSGTATYTTSFARPAGVGPVRIDFGKIAETARVKVNGKELGTLIKSPYHITIPADVLQPQNTVEVAVSNLGANRIIDMDKRGVEWKRFYNTNMPSGGGGRGRGPNGQFSAAGWEPLPSGILGPVRVIPMVPIDLTTVP